MDNNFKSELSSPSNLAVELWRKYGCQVCVHCDIAIGNMTLGQGHDTPLSHGQQLCEILSRSNLAVRSFRPDTYIWYVSTVILALEVWPWVEVMTHPWVMDTNCLKYPDPTWKWEFMERTRILDPCVLWPWPWVKVMTHPWVMDNNCVKIIIQIGQRGKKLWSGHDVNRRTDRHTDRGIPI